MRQLNKKGRVCAETEHNAQHSTAVAAKAGIALVALGDCWTAVTIIVHVFHVTLTAMRAVRRPISPFCDNRFRRRGNKMAGPHKTSLMNRSTIRETDTKYRTRTSSKYRAGSSVFALTTVCHFPSVLWHSLGTKSNGKTTPRKLCARRCFPCVLVWPSLETTRYRYARNTHKKQGLVCVYIYIYTYIWE